MKVSDKQRNGRHRTSFHKCLEQVRNFKASNGRLPGSKDNLRLYNWLARQRWRYNRGQLKQSKITLLNSVGINWNLRESTAEKNFNKLLAFTRAHPHKSLPVSVGSLYGWWRYQLKIKSKWSKNRQVGNAMQRIEKQLDLNTAIHKEQRRQEQWGRWEKVLKELMEWRKSHGNRFPHHDMEDPNARRLCSWYHQMRKRIIEQPEFAPWKKRFITLGIMFLTKQEKWQRSFTSLQQYITKHDYLPPTKHPLREWFRFQRRHIKELSPPQQKKIQQLSSFRSVYAVQWDKQFEKFKTFFRKHHRFPTTSEDEPMLSWFRRQKLESDKGKLEPSRLKRLQQITGLPNLHIGIREGWEYRFDELKKWRSRHPERWPTKRSLGIERILGAWCNTQRQLYSGMRSSSLRLTPDRIRKLESIGFPWEINRKMLWYQMVNWEKRYKEFKHYVNKQGVRAQLLAKNNPSLYIWWRTQVKENKKEKLPQYRIEKLRQLGIKLK